MRADMSEQPQSAPAMLSSRLRARWYRRAAARLSLQGKLILCFMMLLLIALSASYCLFLREARTNLWRSSCERTVALAQTLSMAATGPLDSNDTANLTRISKDFVKNDNIVGVAFANSTGQVVAWACQDPDYRPQQAISGSGSSSLMQPQRAYSSVLGNIVKVTAPVLRYQTEGGAGISQGTRLVGYVTISLSTRDEEQALSRVYVILVMVGCLVLLLTFPAVCWAFLSVLWFGLSGAAPVLTIVLIVIPFVALNIWEGTKAVEKNLLEMGSVYRAGRSLMLRKVLIPQLMPYIFSSLRIALSLSWKIALVAEAFGATSGVGQKLIYWFQDTRVDMMLAWGLSFMIVMALIDLLVFRLWARRSFAWRPQFAT